MRRDLADNLKNYKFYFALIDELVKLYTSNIGYCSVPHHNRSGSGSESGYSIWKLIKMVARSIIAYSAIPYKLFLFSFLTSATAFGMLLVYYLKFGSISNAAFMLVTVFSVVLFLLGFTLLFAYLFHITGYISKKPLYHISEKI